MSKLTARLRPVMRALAPFARVAQAATGVLGQLQKPTLFGVVNAVAGGAVSISDALVTDTGNQGIDGKPVGYATLVAAFRSSGADVYERRIGGPSNKRQATCTVGDESIEIYEQGPSVYFSSECAIGIEVCRKVLDRVLPNAVRIFDSEGLTFAPYELTSMKIAQADEILARTRKLADGGRAILLEGRPGVGKTTIAQAIARDAGLGRTVVIDADALSHSEHRRDSLHNAGLSQFSPGVIIVDDIDKVKLPLRQLEMLRKESRLVIMTANNGKHDTVLDAALMRPARIDEVFTIASSQPHRRPPFDRLDDAIWAEVCDWPCAYVNEVEKRLNAGVDLNIEELRGRMKMRTRSGQELI